MNDLHFNPVDKASFCFSPLMSNLTLKKEILGNWQITHRNIPGHNSKNKQHRLSALRTSQGHINTSSPRPSSQTFFYLCTFQFYLINLTMPLTVISKCFSVTMSKESLWRTSLNPVWGQPIKWYWTHGKSYVKVIDASLCDLFVLLDISNAVTATLLQGFEQRHWTPL